MSLPPDSTQSNRKAFAVKLAPLKENFPETFAGATSSSKTKKSRPPLGQIMENQDKNLDDTRYKLHSSTMKSAEKKESPIQRHSRSADVTKTSPRTGLLRYGERVEDLFGIPQVTPWEDPFYRKCRQLYTIEEGPSTKRNERERCQLWLDVLNESQKHTNLHGSSLVRLHRRATSRLPWEKDSELAPLLLDIWLAYVRVLVEHASLSDAQLALRHLGAKDSAAYHLVLVEVEERKGTKESKIIQLLRTALAEGAEPKAAIYQALTHRGVILTNGTASPCTGTLGKRGRSNDSENSPKRCRILDSGTSERGHSLDVKSLEGAESLDDSDMSLDDDNEAEEEGLLERDSETLKWKTSTGKKKMSIAIKTSANKDKGTNGSHMLNLPSSTSESSSAKKTDQSHLQEGKATPVTNVRNRQPFTDSIKNLSSRADVVSRTQQKSHLPSKISQSHVAAQRQRRPLLNKLPRMTKLTGKAQRADPNQSTLMEEEDNSMEDFISHASSAVQSTSTESTNKDKRMISKLDLSYIFEWNPNKRFEEQKCSQPEKLPLTTTMSTDSSEGHHSGDQKSKMEGKETGREKKERIVEEGKTELPHDRHSEEEEIQDVALNNLSRNAKLLSIQKQPPATSEKLRTTSKHSETNRDFISLVSERNILRVNEASYVKLGVVGKGGSCKVYRALSKDCTVVAIKKVKTDGLNQKAIESYANEIKLLKSLSGNPAIIQMYDSQVDLKRKAIFVVMELGEVDLNHVLQQQNLVVKNGEEGRRLNMNFVRLTWFQMLSAVHGIHEARIIHGDLKPANFLFVRGSLKLIDFGIAKAIQSDDTTNIYRDSQIGTLNYMSPEAIIESDHDPNKPKLKLGRASDIWSLGCILYQMVYGKTPFAHLQIIQKLQAIINPKHRIDYPDDVEEAAVDAIQACLKRKPEERLPIVGPGGLLNEHIFLNPSKQKRWKNDM